MISFGRNETIKWEVAAGDYVLWIRWKDIFSSDRDLTILDLWELRDGDSISITSRIEDVPQWFELHPTEVSGSTGCFKMQRRLESGYKPSEPCEGPNLWRVRTGDRIVRIRIGNGNVSHPTEGLIAFRCNALVFGERLVHSDEVPWFISFGAPLEEHPSEELTTRIQAELGAIKRLGLPGELADTGSNWTLS